MSILHLHEALHGRPRPLTGSLWKPLPTQAKRNALRWSLIALVTILVCVGLAPIVAGK